MRDFVNFISLGNELKPEPYKLARASKNYFISLGNELKPELAWVPTVLLCYFISLGNELKPEHRNGRLVTM